MAAEGEKLGEVFVEIKLSMSKLESDMKTLKEKLDKGVQKLKVDYDTTLGKKKISELQEMQTKLKAVLDKKISMNVDANSLDRTRAVLGDVQNKLRGVGTVGEEASSNLSSGFKKFLTTIGSLYAIRQVADFIKDITTQAGQFEEMSSYFKGSAEDMQNFRKATQDTVSDMNLVRLSNQAGDLGIQLKDQPLLFALAKRAAEAYGTDVSSGFQLITMATEGNIRGLRAVGIQKQVYTDIVKSLARAHGGLITEMDAETQKEIRMQAIIQATGMTMDKINSSMKSHADRIETITTQWENFKVKLGEVFLGTFAGIADVVNGLTEKLTALKTPMQEVTDKGQEQLTSFNTLASRYEYLKEKVSLTKDEKVLLKKTIDDLQNQFPNYLQNIDLMNGKYEDSVRAIDGARESLEKYTEAQVLNMIAQGKMAELADLTAKKLDAEKALADRKAQIAGKGIIPLKDIKAPNETDEKKNNMSSGLQKGQDVILEQYTKDLQDKTKKLEDAVVNLKTQASELMKGITSPSTEKGKDDTGSGLTPEAIDARAQKELAAQQKKEQIIKNYYDKVTFDDQGYWNYRAKQIEADRQKEKAALGDNFNDFVFTTDEKKGVIDDYVGYLNRKLKGITGTDVYKFSSSGELQGFGDPSADLTGDLTHLKTPSSMKTKNTGTTPDALDPKKQQEDWKKQNSELAAIADTIVHISSTFSSAIDNMLFKGESFTQSFGNAFKSMGEEIISTLAEIAVKFAMLQAAKAIFGAASGGFGGFLISALGGHSGGEFVGTNTGVMKMTGGGNFIVPQGYQHDSFPLMVESGERVSVTPASQVNNQQNNFNDSRLVNAIQAMNMNMIKMGQKPVEIHLSSTDPTLAVKKQIGVQNKLVRGGLNTSEIIDGR